MEPPRRNSNLLPWQWALIGVVSTLILALSGFSLWNLITPQISVSASTDQSNEDVRQKILGTWEANDNSSGTLIFAPNGKLFMQTSPDRAIEAGYKIDATQKPIHLDIVMGEDAPPVLPAIFDFTTDGQLRVEIFRYGQQRTTSFGTGAKFLKKVSNQTAPLPGVRISKSPFYRTNETRQSEAKVYVGTLNKGQQAYFEEKNYFSRTVEDLGIGIKTETENYSYKVVVVDNKRVQTIGVAKKDALKSYTGARVISF
jgi:Type IV pilin-like G and H, putative